MKNQKSRNSIWRLLAVTIAAGIVWLAGSVPLRAQTPTQTPVCNEASLKGKYSFAGSGDIYSGLLCKLLGVCDDTTVDTVGYIIADGKGNITSARLFESNNAGVSDTTYFGNYTITDCDTGTLKLITWSQTLNFTLDLNRIQGPKDPEPNVAITAEGEDTDEGREEAINLSHTLDPVGCGTTLNFDGRNFSGMQRGYTPTGQKLSAIISMDFAPGGTFSGIQKQSVNGQYAASPYTGSYTVNFDCTVTASRTVNGMTEAGASIILGNGLHFSPNPWIWQGESCQPNTDTYGPNSESPTGTSQEYDANTVC